MNEIKSRVSDFAMLEINYNALAEADTISIVYFDLENMINVKPSSSDDELFSSFFPVCVEGINGVCNMHLDVCGQTSGERKSSIEYVLHALDNQCKSIFVRHDLAVDVVNKLSFATGSKLPNPDKFTLVDDNIFKSETCLFSGYDNNKSVHRALRWAHAIQCHLHKNK